MATVRWRYGRYERFLRNFSVAGQRRLVRRTLSRARRDLARVYRRHLRSEIMLATRRRSGALLKVRVITRMDPNKATLTIEPTFPATTYATPPGRGRRRASKRGQYAFVLNATPTEKPRAFVQRAGRRFEHDLEVQSILRKHFSFVLRQAFQLR